MEYVIQNTPGPLCSMVHYNTVVDITLIIVVILHYFSYMSIILLKTERFYLQIADNL